MPRVGARLGERSEGAAKISKAADISQHRDKIPSGGRNSYEFDSHRAAVVSCGVWRRQPRPRANR